MSNLCIDFGSTFIKYFIHDGEKVVFSDKLRFPAPCVCEGDAYEIPVQSIDAAVRKIFSDTEGYRVWNCFLAVQMHGYVLQKTDGTFSNYISWKDRRGDLSAPLLQKIDFEQNGTSLKRNLPAVKLCSLEQECTFFTLGSYIAYYLTGKNITHKTDACASGLFDAQTLEPVWLPRVIALPEVTHRILPVGSYQGIRIYTPVGDHQVSFLGSGAGNDAYLLNIGTATQISTLALRYEKDARFEKRPFFTDARLVTVSGLPGGELLYDGYSPEEFSKAVLSALTKLPAKNKVLVGGGGADLVFEKLRVFLKDYGIECVKLESNISKEGLIEIMKMCKTQIGVMLSEVCFPNFPIILKNERMGFLIVDNEHGSFDYSFLSAAVMNARLVDLPLIVRLPDNNRRDITKLADMGVAGFLLPMTNSAADIQKVVDYAKYAPVGKRGISTNRAHTLYNPPPMEEYIPMANKRVKVYAQIETKAGVDNIEEILSVNGVDGIFVGPNDLSCDMGCIGDQAPVMAAIRAVSAAAHRHNKPWGIITTSKELIACSRECGVDFICYGSEINMLKNACKTIRGLFWE